MNANLQKGIDKGGLCFCDACRIEHRLPIDIWFKNYLGKCKICEKEGQYLKYANAKEILEQFNINSNTNTMQLQGKITVIMDLQTFDSGFTKREMVIETKEEYPQMIKCEFIKEKANLLDNYAIGDEVEVSINIRGNEYNGKYFVNIQGWRIKALEQTPEAEQAPAPRPIEDAFGEATESDLF